MRASAERRIIKALYGRAVGRRPHGRPKIWWIDNVRLGRYIPGGEGYWEASARDCNRWKALVEAAAKRSSKKYQYLQLIMQG